MELVAQLDSTPVVHVAMHLLEADDLDVEGRSDSAGGLLEPGGDDRGDEGATHVGLGSVGPQERLVFAGLHVRLAVHDPVPQVGARGQPTETKSAARLFARGIGARGVRDLRVK